MGKNPEIRKPKPKPPRSRESNFSYEDDGCVATAIQESNTASNDQDFDDPLMRPGPVPLYPYGLGFMDVGDFQVVCLDVYTVVYSVNQDDGVLRVWLNKIAKAGGEMELEPPGHRYSVGEAANVKFAALRLRMLDETPASAGLEIDTVVVSQDDAVGRLVVAVLVRSLDTNEALADTQRERGVEGLWWDEYAVKEGAGIMEGEIGDEELKRQVLRGFDVLKEIRFPPIDRSRRGLVDG
ncbi:hypothetical protein M409DRAFT_57668 [Zasmidium cellare ATCC 36951]|uniref:Uncharacterized protein n=1 Tax=Zasmidium cellare ATCC 36951 TaxID=1080233 RepID=A0A6A6C984_ZASCE|nr:uncharacterized protein M409DRAFT_57668 [Zasmidium cellare ATCC 36951]KAF2163393.1 hypothetical protein M409DRAFT_57668 [Zasmidium cellare ATCC 36951]